MARKKYYDIETQGFYDSDINKNIPESAVEISEDKYKEIYTAQAAGRIISLDGAVLKIEDESEIQVNSKRISELKNLMNELDRKRIRPLAEGDTEYLSELNTLMVSMREELRALLDATE